MAWIQQRALIQDSCVPTRRRAERWYTSIREYSRVGWEANPSSSAPQQGESQRFRFDQRSIDPAGLRISAARAMPWRIPHEGRLALNAARCHLYRGSVSGQARPKRELRLRSFVYTDESRSVDTEYV